MATRAKNCSTTKDIDINIFMPSKWIRLTNVFLFLLGRREAKVNVYGIQMECSSTSYNVSHSSPNNGKIHLFYCWYFFSEFHKNFILHSVNYVVCNFFFATIIISLFFAHLLCGLFVIFSTFVLNTFSLFTQNKLQTHTHPQTQLQFKFSIKIQFGFSLVHLWLLFSNL